MTFIAAARLPVKEPRPGWLGRFFHSEHMTFAYYDIQAGASVHVHHHENEEVWHVISGEIEMVVAHDKGVVRAGEAVVVPAGVSTQPGPGSAVTRSSWTSRSERRLVASTSADPMATHKEIRVSGMAIWRLPGGKIVEH